MPSTRRLGGCAAQALFAAVLPGNVEMALDWRRRAWMWQLVSLVRLPLQGVLIGLAGEVARRG